MFEMSQVSDSKEKAAKTAAKTAESAAYSAFEMPSAVRDIAERGVRQAKDAYDSYKAMAEEATDTMEDTFATISKGATELQTKALSNAKAQVDAGFDLVEKLIAARSLSEVMELHSTFARAQFDTLSAQTREFQALASKVQSDSAKPFNEGMSKVLGQWKQVA